MVDLLSDSDDEPAQGSPAVGSPAVDGHVAQLVDMGFTPEQAAQVSGALPCMQLFAQSRPVLCRGDFWAQNLVLNRLKDTGGLQSACRW